MKINIFFKIAFPIILMGVFVVVVFIALNYEKLTLSFFIILSLITFFVFLYGFMTGEKFASPVKKLLEKVQELSKGVLTTRIYLETKDELGELAGAFNKIAEDLEKSQTVAKKAKNIVDIRVKARTQDLEETIKNLEQKTINRAVELQKMVQESEKLQGLIKSREGEVTTLKKEVKRLKDELSYKPKKRSNNTDKDKDKE